MHATNGKALRGFGDARPLHPYAWIWEPLEQHSSFVLRPMFGAKAVYLHGLMMLCFCARKEPWRGVFVCTDFVHHASLRRQFPSLRSHDVLAKWLYLPESSSDFETCAHALADLAWRRDPRIGVLPQPKKRRRGATPQRPAATQEAKRNK